MTLGERIDTLLADIEKEESKAIGQLAEWRVLLERYRKEDPEGYKRASELKATGKPTPLEDQLVDRYKDYKETVESVTAKRVKLDNLEKQFLERD